jgi:hypothetical protein
MEWHCHRQKFSRIKWLYLHLNTHRLMGIFFLFFIKVLFAKPTNFHYAPPLAL